MGGDRPQDDGPQPGGPLSARPRDHAGSQKSRTDDQGGPERGRRRAAFGDHHSHGCLRSREQRQRATVATPSGPPTWRERFLDWPLSRHLTALGIAALILGSASAAVGWWLRPSDPLQTPTLKQDVPREANAEKQVERATQLRSDPDAWKAVLDYFPDDRVYTVQAKERLAVLYLRTLRLKEAGKLFSELDGMGRENPKEHSIGVAGEAVIATLQKDYRKSQSLIYDLGDLSQRRTQLSTDLWQMLQRAGAINAKELGEQENKQLQELFEGEP